MINLLSLDIKQALRNLRRAPGFTAAAILTLALGIGANTALFTLLQGILMKPPAFQNPDRIVVVSARSNQRSEAWQALSAQQFGAISREISSLVDLAALRDTQVSLRAEDKVQSLKACLVSPGGLQVLGVPFALGRDFVAGEAGQDAPGAVILTHGTWVRRFGRDPAILKHRISVDGRSLEVIGVLGAKAKLPMLAESMELALPLNFAAGEKENRDMPSCWVMGCLKPGVTLPALRIELKGIAPSLAPQGSSKEGWSLDALTLIGLDLQMMGPELAVLSAMTLFILLLTCSNVAGLSLARLGLRAREAALRSALGAHRGQLITGPFAEVSILALGSASLVVAVAWTVSHLVGGPLREAFKVDGKLIGFTFLSALLVAVSTGFIPALLGSRTNLRELLHQGSASVAGGSPMRWRRALIILQVALATVLLAGAGLMGRALWRLQGADLGIQPQNVLTAQFTLPQEYNPQAPDRIRLFYDEVTAHLSSLPGVETVGVADGMPLYDRGDKIRFWVEGDGADTADQASLQRVSSAYFKALGIPLVRGRVFQDWEQGLGIISEPLARKRWPGQDPLGHRISLAGPAGPWITVIGVAAAHRHNDAKRGATEQILTSFRAEGCGYYAVLLRTTGKPGALAPALRSALSKLTPGLVVDRVEPLQAVVDMNLEGPRLLGWILGAFGLVAGFLAALGIHGVTASLVQQRRREFGLRMALGAQSVQVLGLVLRQNMVHVGLGMLLGCVGAIALGRVMASQLAGLNPWDLPSLLAGTFCLGLLSVLASLAPAMGAVRVHPAETLRSE